MKEQEIRAEILKAIDATVRKYMSQLKFNTTRYGKVVSYGNGVAVVLIDDNEYRCKSKISVGAGSSVRVIVPNNDYTRMYVDGLE